MSLEVLDRLGVPAKHPICREALMAWWFVPSKHEQEFFRVLEHVWTRIVTPRMASLIFAHFRHSNTNNSNNHNNNNNNKKPQP